MSANVYGAIARGPFDVFGSDPNRDWICEIGDDGEGGGIYAYFGNWDSELYIDQLTISSTADTQWVFDSVAGFGISGDDGEHVTTMIDYFQNATFGSVSAGNITSEGGGNVWTTLMVDDPGAPPSDTLAHLAAWCGTLYTNLANASFFA